MPNLDKIGAAGLHICVGNLTIIGSDNGLSPGRHQAIIWTNAGILLIRTLGTNFSEILGKINSFPFKKMHVEMSSAKGRLLSLGLNVLILCNLHMEFAHPGANCMYSPHFGQQSDNKRLRK